MQLSTIELSQQEQQEIERLLAFSEHSPMAVNDLWKMMDIVWDEMECDNHRPDPEKISAYYSHPVWTLNGLFIEQDDISMGHRRAIASWITNNPISNVLDYGGGFGTLARLIAVKGRNINLDIYEPFPSQLAIAKMREFSNVNFVASLDREYDCLVCIDVLEHVPNPLELFAMMIATVKVGGVLIIANCFYPEIKCHLPSTLHFRHTFKLCAMMMGLRVLGNCKGSHATIYKRVSARPINWQLLSATEKLSKNFFLISEIFNSGVKLLGRLTKIMLGNNKRTVGNFAKNSPSR
jgi:2-polyprenyl-3-methyl-5-hydroxy-6-metoxy-1,4-benzoquinol methylase